MTSKLEHLEKLLAEATPAPWTDEGCVSPDHILACALRNSAPAMLDVIRAAKAYVESNSHQDYKSLNSVLQKFEESEP